MFRIVDAGATGDMIRITVETDEASTLLFMRFMREAQSFADAYAFRARGAAAGARRREERAAELPERIARRARTLALFRELKGSRTARLKALREILAARGEAPPTVGRLDAELTLARSEERETQRLRVAELRSEGRSYREIGRILGIPESTARYLQKNARGWPISGDLAPAAGIPFPAFPEHVGDGAPGRD